MRSFPSRYALSGCVAAAMLAGCGSLPLSLSKGQGDMPPIGTPGAMRPTAPRIPPTGSFMVLHQFDRAGDGERPEAGLINVKGTLYGTTSNGGSYFFGTVFSITTAGSEKVLYSFKGGADGSYPESGLLNVNGALYGTTANGGGSGCSGHGCGTVYRVSLTGAQKVLHRFGDSPDGAAPTTGLIDVNGTLYGTTANGGSGCDSGYGCGTVYSITTSGSEKVLYSFAGGRDGAYPDGALINEDGTLYGTTVTGGSDKYGTFYSISTSGSEKVLHTFGASDDGGSPLGNLLDVKGTLYGTTAYGGRHSSGTVYRISTTGVEKVLYDFPARRGGREGKTPYAGLIAVKGTLYGTTEWGGGPPFWGVVYSVSTAGAETVLHRFGNGSAGAHPRAGLVNVKGKLYGTTYDHGTGCSGGGCGTIFALTP
jgi:uncharacterized repeat protein (TIGR03803 family)